MNTYKYPQHQQKNRRRSAATSSRDEPTDSDRLLVSPYYNYNLTTVEDQTPAPDFEQETIPIKRGKVSSLTVYDVFEEELNILERGGPASYFLNFAIFLLSTSIAFLISLIFANIESRTTHDIFVIVTGICFIGGIAMLILWYIFFKTTSQTIKKIRDRIPKEKIKPEIPSNH